MRRKKKSRFRNNKPGVDFQHVISFQELKEKKTMLLSTALSKELWEDFYPGKGKTEPRKNKTHIPFNN